MSPDDLIASLEEQIIQQKAELTYWKETAEYWKQTSYKFLKELNKTIDN